MRIAFFVGVAFWLAMAGGYVANIYKLCLTGFEVATWGGFEIARAAGILVAPLGAILGYF